MMLQMKTIRNHNQVKTLEKVEGKNALLLHIPLSEQRSKEDVYLKKMPSTLRIESVICFQMENHLAVADVDHLMW